MPNRVRSDAVVHSDTLTGKAIRDQRHRMGFTQQELADAIGMSRSYLACLEKGRNGIYVSWLLLIADVLEADPWDLAVRPPATDSEATDG